jgi:hypothetical protein
VTTIGLPSSGDLSGALLFANDAVTPQGVRICADDEIRAYGMNRQHFTTDAYLALPTDALGREYVTMGYPSDIFHVPFVGEGSQFATSRRKTTHTSRSLPLNPSSGTPLASRSSSTWIGS